MTSRLALVTVVVRDYDEAIEWYCDRLGFTLAEDTPLSPEKRWVVVSPSGGGTGLLLARAATATQEAHVGGQTGGRVFLFLHTDDFARDYSAMRTKGVRFAGEPREESYGRVVVFEDLYGNKWDLIEPALGTG